MWVGNDLFRAVDREVEYAIESNETRPLWQLLVAVAVFATVTNPEEVQFLSYDLRNALQLLEQVPTLDPDNQCKEKLRGLIMTYSWMRTPGDSSYLSNQRLADWS